MFFKLRLYGKNGKLFRFSDNCEINNDGGFFSDYINYAFKDKLCVGKDGTECKSISFKIGFPSSIMAKIKAKTEWVEDDEAYAISVGENTVVYAKREGGFIFAVATLMQLIDGAELYGGLIYDYPYSNTRG